jgi:hypothetical protein
MKMYPARVRALLYELCVDLGFCLPTEAGLRLENDPPVDIDKFTDAVFREEGMDPLATKNAKIRKQVRELVAKYFEEFWRDAKGQSIPPI